jgi:hypothetical protein
LKSIIQNENVRIYPGSEGELLSKYSDTLALTIMEFKEKLTGFKQFTTERKMLHSQIGCDRPSINQFFLTPE